MHRRVSLSTQSLRTALVSLTLAQSVGCGSSRETNANTQNNPLPAGGQSATGGQATSDGASGESGAWPTGGRTGTATATAIQLGGALGTGGTLSVGGVEGSGGADSTGGRTSSASTMVTGGTRSVGGASAVAGAFGTGTGGRTNTGGVSGSGGAATGGKTWAGGTGALGGAGGSGAGSSMFSGMVDAKHVRLLSGSPFYDRQELHRKGYLASFSYDKLLYPYRSFAKLPQASGVTGGYAGWDTGFLVGHMTGHYLSAVSRMAAATGDTTFTTKANTVVAELAKCQTAINGGGYLAAFPTTVFDWLEGKSVSNNGIVVPYYTVHKIMAGLLDAYHYVGNQQALDVVSKMADYFQARLAALPAATIEKIFRTDGSGNPQNEFGAMSDTLSELSAATGKSIYLDTAKIFNRSWFITPLAAGQDNLSGLHGNAHIAQALGIAHTANLSGDSASLLASENFWKLLTGKHAFVTGGDSFHEWLDKAGVEAGPSIDASKSLPPTTAETCNTHNMLKLTSALFERSPRIDYADYYERALYNHILASVASDTGNVTYFTPLYGNFRTYLNGTFCDNGTGIENTPRYNEGIYFEQGNSLWINLYIPSVLTWDATGLTLQQEGNAAAGEQVQITITKGSDGTQATLNLRIPYWVSGAPTVAVNGVQQQSVNTKTYYSISRQWNVGDIVKVTLPASLRLEHAQDVTSMVAVFSGPILLAGALGTANMPSDYTDKDANLGISNVTVPTIANSSTNPADWLQQVAGSPLTYTVQNAGAANGITFQPLYQIHHQRYSVYWPR
jgi:uncharacterized protein